MPDRFGKKYKSGDMAKADRFGKKYKIVRFFAKEGKRQKVIRRDCTLNDARAHCSQPMSRKAGVWFDGIQEQ